MHPSADVVYCIIFDQSAPAISLQLAAYFRMHTADISVIPQHYAHALSTLHYKSKHRRENIDAHRIPDSISVLLDCCERQYRIVVLDNHLA